MAKIKAFKGIRPTRDKVHLVASRSYVTYDKQALYNKLSENPFTFIHIINPEFKIPQENIDQGIERFKRVKDRFQDFVDEGVYHTEKKESLYIYRQIKADQTHTGIIAASAIEDYINKKIKVHEHTITNREIMFKDYLRTCGFNAEPVLLSYPDNDTIESVIDRYTEERPEYDFTSTNKVRHQLWVIDNPEDLAIIENAFENVDSLYIADGHHRSASSARLCEEIQEENKDQANTNASYNYCMSYLIGESQLRIYDFNRLVKDLNGLSVADFLKEVEKTYEINLRGEKSFCPVQQDEISMYLDKKWYSLKARPEFFDASCPVGSLDPEILSNNILDPILGIKDPKNDPRIAFLDGVKGMDGLQNVVDSGAMTVAFGLKPISVEQLKRVADEERIMPPKSTYIEPKLRSGMIIYSLES